MRSSKQRSRSKSNRPRTMGNITNRVFDSSGPDGKVRGTPQQIIDKYLLLARDAQLSNDRVAAEGFLQHAEHYTRLLGEAQREIEARRGESGEWSGGQGDSDQYGDQANGPDREGDQNSRQQNDRRQNDRGQGDRNQNDRNQNDRGQNDRGQNDRNQNERGRNGHGQGDRERRGAPQADQPPAAQGGGGPRHDDGGDRPGRDGQVNDNPEYRRDRARGSFDEVIDLQDSDAGEAGLIETPEARAPADAGPSTDAEKADAPAKPARRRAAGPRKPRKAAEGGSDAAAPGEPVKRAPAAE